MTKAINKPARPLVAVFMVSFFFSCAAEKMSQEETSGKADESTPSEMVTILNLDGQTAQAYTDHGNQPPQIITDEPTRFIVANDPSAIRGLGLAAGMTQMPAGTQVTLHFKLESESTWQQLAMKDCATEDIGGGRAFCFTGILQLDPTARGVLEYWYQVVADNKEGTINLDYQAYKNFTLPVIAKASESIIFAEDFNNPSEARAGQPLASGSTVHIVYSVRRMASLFQASANFRSLPDIEANPMPTAPAAYILWQIEMKADLLDASSAVVSSQTLDLRNGKGEDAISQPDIFLAPAAKQLVLSFTTSLAGEAAEHPAEYGADGLQMPVDTNAGHGYVFLIE